MTIAAAFDFPFRRTGQKKDGEPCYAVGTLRMEPIPAEAVEYAVHLPDDALVPPVMPSFLEAARAGLKEGAEENDLAGLRVTLARLLWHDVNSSALSMTSPRTKRSVMPSKHTALSTAARRQRPHIGCLHAVILVFG